MKTHSSTSVEIRFSDIDMAGHVHNSRYLSFFEQARIDFMGEMTGPEWNWRERGIVLGRNEIDYITPIYLNDKIYVITKCDHVGNKSFTLSYELFKINPDGDDQLCTKGRSILVCMDFKTDESQPLFDEWKNYLLASLEA
ncbi:MAG: acyl-CoA thioesterase [Flavobacteriales bacterium]|nr:acyl-CoA thioesterase [Flavobacteriales bacterium]